MSKHQFYLLIYLPLILLLPYCSTNSNEITSPDGNIYVKVESTNSNQLYYQILSNEDTIISKSQLGLIRDDGDFTKGLTIQSITPSRSIKQNYTLLHGKQNQITYKANRKTYHIKNQSQQKMDIIFQVSNDGVAFRYHFPEHSEEKHKIEQELTEFKFQSGTHAWIQPMSKAKTGWEHCHPSYEEYYIKNKDISQLPEHKPGWVFPALFKSGNYWTLLTETAPDRNYCGCNLSHQKGDNHFKIGFPQPEEIFPGGALKPTSDLPWRTPWRIITIGKELETIVESTLGTDLAKPSVVDDVSCIEPGQAAWSWVLLKDDSIVYNVQKRFIDYAAEMNWEYCLIDVDWNKKIGYDKIAELADYGRKKDVGLILWYNSAGKWNTTPYEPRNKLLTSESRNKEFAKLQKMGIRGIKVDFFGGDGQSMMAYYQDIFEDAAKYGLMVNCHGSTIPRGWHRTYPNLVTMESVKGFEFVTFEQQNADEQPAHCCILPYTRNVFDPMDFTPVCFSDIPNIERKTSNAFELALAVIFQSGIQHYAEIPRGMARVPDYVQNVMKEIPVAWDETQFISGFPGESVIIARRDASTWYVAGINGQNQDKSFKIDLPFISNKKGRLITDGTNKRSFQQKIINLDSDPLELKIKAHGGFVLVFER